jgi:hypothetical protein
MKPKRIQRKRTRGWRMPEGAVYVGRPTKWGNPWHVEDVGQYEAADLYRAWMLGWRNNSAMPPCPDPRELRGKDLACWCPLVNRFGVRVPCHADVLLELANAPVTREEPT